MLSRPHRVRGARVCELPGSGAAVLDGELSKKMSTLEHMASQQRIEKLKVFLGADPDDAFTRYALALEYRGIGESERAAETLLDLIARDPAYVPAYHQLGQIFGALKKTGQAQDIYQRGIAAAAQGDAHAQKEMQDELDELDHE